jgi:AcrR family transcriptional regulator
MINLFTASVDTGLMGQSRTGSKEVGVSDSSKRQIATNSSGDDAVRRRLAPCERRDMIVQAAVELFAGNGVGASTRDIARRAGITQPLLYRYFPDKDSLVQAVYEQVFLQSWNPDWDALIADRGQGVQSRFQQFYEAYCATICDPVWLRLWHFAALRDGRMTLWYRDVVEEQILKPLVRERRAELHGIDTFRVARDDLEAPWLLHGGLMNHAFRRQVESKNPAEAAPAMIARMLRMYMLLTAAEPISSGDHET